MTESRLVHYISVAEGAVFSKPRVVRRRASQPPVKVCEFLFKFVDDAYLSGDHQLSELEEDDLFLRSQEDMVRRFLETDQIYTDKYGVIHRFYTPEHDLWWIELTGIGVKELKVPNPPKKDIALPDGPLIEGKVVSSEIESEGVDKGTN